MSTQVALPLSDGTPRYKIELPKPGDDTQQYGGTRTVREAYNFDVGHQIGEGTYGQVFKGQCKKNNDKVALKKIRMDSEKEGFPITAIREIKILSSLKHENIVNLREIVRGDIHKSNNFKGSIYMVFDYADHDLTGLMDTVKYKFTEPQVKCIMKQLLKGLAHVHLNGVLHRDLKASNILINSQGVVKLADFGLARTYQDKQDAQLTNRVITLWYRPPELLLGASRYGPEVDMWSVGCILAELLVGKPLFPGKDEADQLDRIFQIMGTPTKDSWPDAERLPGYGNIVKGRYPGGKLRQWVMETAAKQHCGNISPSAVTLLERLLTLDPARRLDALSAFRDPWFWNHEPQACDPMSLPVSGSSHEYTMKQKRQQQQQQHRGDYAHQDKRQRPNPAPPAGGVSGGYGGGGQGGPRGPHGQHGGQMGGPGQPPYGGPRPGQPMGPPQARPPYGQHPPPGGPHGRPGGPPGGPPPRQGPPGGPPPQGGGGFRPPSHGQGNYNQRR